MTDSAFGVVACENRRDNAAEPAVREILGEDLPVEADLWRWFPVWGAPGI